MNRFITILLLVLSAATASAQKAADWRDLLTIVDDNNRTVYYERESHKPLKGEYRIKRGLDIEFVKLKDGVIDGDYRRYRNGELRESGKYVKGKREGDFTEYHSGGKTVRKTIPMKDGRIDGVVRTYFSDGSLDTEKTYRMSVEHGAERRYDNATHRQVFETHYIDGKKEGEEWETADNGNGTQSRIVRHYADGLLNGKYRNELTRDGKLIYLIEGEYLGGEKTGQWIEYNYEAGTASTSWLGEGGA